MANTVRAKATRKKFPHLNLGEKAHAPGSVSPMLATLVREPFTNPDWLYEVKWDGFRLISHIIDGKVTLRSRKGENYTRNYSPVVQALQKLKHNAVLDGEVVAIDKDGRPNFDELQRWNGSLPLMYYVFDIVWLNGRDLTTLPLNTRKQILQSIIAVDDPVVKFSDSFDDGTALYELMKEKGWEGIVAKKKDSTYVQGTNNKRTLNWQKIPTARQQEFVVGGWAESNSGRPFRTLIFGYYENGKLIYQGHAGGGFKEKEMPSIFNRLKKLEIKKSPFTNTDTVLKYAETPIHWVKPEFVIQVRYATTTRSGMIRKPAIFLGFRDDKDPKDVVLEQPAEQNREKLDKPLRQKKETSEESNWPIIENIPITTQEQFDVGGHSLLLTNVEKQLWKEVTNADLITYYHSVSDYILPHLRDRPLSLHIKHIKPTVEGLYIKDMEGRQPEWAEIFTTPRKHKRKGMREQIDYLVCNNEATLLWQINLGCIDINPWTSQVTNPDEPHYIVIDLDPSDDDFSKAVPVAVVVKDYLKKLKLTGFPKTSGKTGIHVYIPCRGFDFTKARSIAERICSDINELIPELTTLNVNKNGRDNKVYLDPNQNDFADTVAAPYSVRPFKIPTVSTPLEWKEVKPGLNSEDYTMHNILKRLQKKGDLFAAVVDERIATTNTKNILKLL